MSDSNKKILDLVASKISDLENAFDQLDSHVVRKATLASVIVKLDADENIALSSTSDDAAAIKAIVTQHHSRGSRAGYDPGIQRRTDYLVRDSRFGNRVICARRLRTDCDRVSRKYFIPRANLRY
jgi:hypothetical protein